MLVYASFGDSDELSFAQGWQREYPKYDPCPKLAVLYDWLISLGYEMSDEEKAMRDGTHELFSGIGTEKDSE